MPDIPNRDAYEKKLASLVGDRLDEFGSRILDALGNPPNPANIPQSLWDEMGEDLTRVIKPQLQQVYADSSALLGNDVANRYDASVRPLVDWTLINQRAADWAKKYTFDLVKGINDTSMKHLQQNVSSFFEEGLDMDGLRSRIREDYSPVRAALIASTEVTRASVNGEMGIIETIEKNSSLKMVPTFNTENDDRVCEICGPDDQQVVSEEDFPPRHVICRCWITWAPEGW